MADFKTKDIVAKVNLSIEIPLKVWDQLDEEGINFYFNHGRLCLSQVIQMIASDVTCLCDETSVTYLRDATEEDLQKYKQRKGLGPCDL